MAGQGAPAFAHIGILHHPKKPESLELACKIGAYLERAGVAEIWHESAWDLELSLIHI